MASDLDGPSRLETAVARRERPLVCCVGCRNSSDTDITLAVRSAGNARPKIRQRDGGPDPDSVCRVGTYVPATWLRLRNFHSQPTLSVSVGRLVMSIDRSHRIAVAIFAVALAVVLAAAFVTTLENVDTRHARNVAQPGTIGLAKPHAPLDRAPGEPVRN